MTDQHVAFVGSIPENCDRYLGPLFFHGYAATMAARLDVVTSIKRSSSAARRPRP